MLKRINKFINKYRKNCEFDIRYDVIMEWVGRDPEAKKTIIKLIDYAKNIRENSEDRHCRNTIWLKGTVDGYDEWFWNNHRSWWTQYARVKAFNADVYMVSPVHITQYCSQIINIEIYGVNYKIQYCLGNVAYAIELAKLLLVCGGIPNVKRIEFSPDEPFQKIKIVKERI